MNAPEWIMYNSVSERSLAQDIFAVAHKKSCIAGVGIELTDITRDSAILKKYKVPSPYILYVGRIDKNKGCGELISFFTRFKKTFKSELHLVIVGKAFMKLPKDDDIIYTGYISDEEKNQLLQQCELLVMPSKYESLSMVVLESFWYSKPVIVNERCEVLKNHVESSGGGFYYKDYHEFALHLKTLLSDKNLSIAKGINGKRYVTENYSWPTILAKYNTAIDDIVGIAL
jgi:glycosyltransferase involved in cell wall biosynthesis